MRKFIPFNILLIFGNTLENTSFCVLFYRANCVTRCANVVRMDAFTLDWNTLVELHRLFFLFLFLHQQQKKNRRNRFQVRLCRCGRTKRTEHTTTHATIMRIIAYSYTYHENCANCLKNRIELVFVYIYWYIQS